MDHTVDTLSRVINRTYDRFAVKAEDVDYIECNATGKREQTIFNRVKSCGLMVKYVHLGLVVQRLRFESLLCC